MLSFWDNKVGDSDHGVFYFFGKFTILMGILCNCVILH